MSIAGAPNPLIRHFRDAELREQVVASFTGGKEAGDVAGAVPVVAKPGDVNLHANSVVHGSFASRTPRLRRVLYLTTGLGRRR